MSSGADFGSQELKTLEDRTVKMREALRDNSKKKELIESLLKIKNKQREVVDFELNAIQQDIVATLTGRDIYVKPRQIGASEVFIALVLLETVLIPGTNSVIIAYEEEATKRLLAKSDAFYDALLASGASHIPVRHHDSEFKKTYRFKDKSGRTLAPTSSFYIASARSFVVARNDTYHNVIADEFAFWPDSSKLVEVLGGVPADGNVYILSTPNGEENTHCEMYRTAKEKQLVGENVYTAHFYPWFQHKEYTLEVDSKDTLARDRVSPLVDIDSDELALIEFQGLTEGQIRWRRYKSAEIEQLRRLGETRALFSQEFPEDDDTCFLTYGNMAYDAVHLDRMMREIKAPLLRAHNADIWYPPLKGVRYVMSIDPGVGKYSMTAITVWAVEYTEDGQEVLKHCATVHGLYGTERTKELAWTLGMYYNCALAAPEANMESLIVQMKDYPNLYYFKDPVTGAMPGRMGWVTSKTTKPIMMDELARMLPNMICHDARIIKEIRGMRYNEKERATSLGHDDLHDAACIAMMCRPSKPIRRGYVGSYGRRR